MATQMEAAQQLCYFAAAVDDGTKEAPALVSMAKMFASDTAMSVTTDAIQISGSSSLERLAHRGGGPFVRNAHILCIEAGR